MCFECPLREAEASDARNQTDIKDRGIAVVKPGQDLMGLAFLSTHAHGHACTHTFAHTRTVTHFHAHTLRDRERLGGGGGKRD